MDNYESENGDESIKLIEKKSKSVDFDNIFNMETNISSRKQCGSVVFIAMLLMTFISICGINLFYHQNTIEYDEVNGLNETNETYIYSKNNESVTFFFGELFIASFSFLIAITIYLLNQFWEEYKNLKLLYDDSKTCCLKYVYNQNKVVINLVIVLTIYVVIFMISTILAGISFISKIENSCLYIAFALILIYYRKPSRFETNVIAPEIWPNLGKSLALWYFHGYLKYVLSTDEHSLRSRIEQYVNHEGVEIEIRKLFILFPTSCYVHGNLADEDPNGIELTKKLCSLELPGKRKFDNTVYKLIGKPKSYFLVTELASPLKTIWEMDSARSKIIQMAKEHRKTVFYEFYNSLKELLENDDSCADTYILVLYHNKINGVKVPLSQVLRNEIKKEKQRIKDNTGILMPYSDSLADNAL